MGNFFYLYDNIIILYFRYRIKWEQMAEMEIGRISKRVLDKFNVTRDICGYILELKGYKRIDESSYKVSLYANGKKLVSIISKEGIPMEYHYAPSTFSKEVFPIIKESCDVDFMVDEMVRDMNDLASLDKYIRHYQSRYFILEIDGNISLYEIFDGSNRIEYATSTPQGQLLLRKIAYKLQKQGYSILNYNVKDII